MVYTIGSGAAPTSAPIGQGAVPSSSSVPIGRGATPNFNWSPPTYTPPRIDIPSSSTTNNNSRSASRSIHIDLGSRHHHRDSYGCHDYWNRPRCDSGIDLPSTTCNSPASSSSENDWCALIVGVVCLLMLIGVAVLLIMGFSTDLFKDLAVSDDDWW